MLILLCLTSCTNTRETGGIALNVSAPQLQTLEPDLKMVISTYDILGFGPSEANFTQTGVSGTFFTKERLAFGEWTIIVKGYNTDNILIGQGQVTVTVHVNQTTHANIVVRPLEGTGVLDLTVNWNADDTIDPSIDALLMPPSGPSQILDFTIINDSTGTYRNNEIEGGYYSLIVKLIDCGTLTMGAVEVVRIVKSAITSGTFDFTQINSLKGSIIVNITPEMANPIDITLSGQKSELLVGGSMTISASVPPDCGNVVYVWYINGESKNTGDTFTVSGLPEGAYRLDVTAFTTDGSRAGSTSHYFSILDQEITFVDTNLENLIRGMIADFNSPIYISEIIHITEIYAKKKSITNLTGLEYFTNLESLNLAYNYVSDVSPLAGLTKLSYLFLYSNQLNNIKPLLSNPGLAAGDVVNLCYNYLDISSPTSDDLIDIRELVSRGVSVSYFPQR